MTVKVDFGMFDWIDRGSGSTAELYESRLKLIELADQAGFYGYHLAEHHSTPLGMAPSPSVFFATLAERTRQIRFSPMAYLLPLYHPLRLVEEICMLDHLSGGRVEVGISRGVSPYEIQSFNVSPEKTREIFDETLEIYCKAMCEPVIEHVGKHYQFHDVPMELEPLQRPYPPLWYPSFTESGTTFAAKNGFNFMSIGPPALMAQLMDLYRDVAKEYKGDRMQGHITEPKLGAQRQIFLAKTDEEALAIAKPAYADWYNSITKLWHRRGNHTYDEFFDWNKCLEAETVLIGSVEKVRDQIHQVIEMSNVNYFVGSFAWGTLSPEDSRKSLELFISEIMPSMQR